MHVSHPLTEEVVDLFAVLNHPLSSAHLCLFALLPGLQHPLHILQNYILMENTQQ